MKNKRYLVYFGILLIAFNFLILIWKAPSLFVFGLDEEYQTTLAMSLVKDLHPIWIGVSAANTGFYLGPAFTYLTALFLFISRGDPLILSYAAVALSLVTVLSLYYVTQKLFNTKTAFIALLLYSFSSLLINYDLRFWNPSPVPLVSIWLIYSLYKLKNDFRWIVLTLSLLALSLHFHLSLLVFWPITFLILLQNRKKIDIKWLVLGIVAYLLFVSPLIVYDLNHNFDNLKTPLRLLTSLSTSLPGDSSSHFLSLLQSIGNLVIPQQSLLIGIVLSVMILGVLVLRLRSSRFDPLSLAIILFTITYLIYPGRVYGYYLLALYPLLAILLSSYLEKISPLFISGLLLLFIVSNLYYFLNQDISHGLMAKKVLIETTGKQIGNSSYELLTVGDYREYGGWRYLFRYYSGMPLRSSADTYFGWIYPEEISSATPSGQVLISNSSPSFITVTQLK